MTRQRFETLVLQALDLIPDKFRDETHNVAVVIETAPDLETLSELEIQRPDTLLGLYQGVPLPERDWTYGNTLPDRITLFQEPIEAASADDEDVIITIGETIIHEFGHYFGLSEDEIEAIETRYWQRHRA
jgi:predicted Zn-dependent protease with MMP-like domain